jgi:hypothetical protein
METETLAARNVVDQLFRARYGVDLCGNKASYAGAAPVHAAEPPVPPAPAAADVVAEETPSAAYQSASEPETPAEPLTEESGQGQQVFTAEPAASPVDTDKVKAKASEAAEKVKKAQKKVEKKVKKEYDEFVYGWDC